RPARTPPVRATPDRRHRIHVGRTLPAVGEAGVALPRGVAAAARGRAAPARVRSPGLRAPVRDRRRRLRRLALRPSRRKPQLRATRPVLPSLLGPGAGASGPDPRRAGGRRLLADAPAAPLCPSTP